VQLPGFVHAVDFVSGTLGGSARHHGVAVSDPPLVGSCRSRRWRNLLPRRGSPFGVRLGAASACTGEVGVVSQSIGCNLRESFVVVVEFVAAVIVGDRTLIGMDLTGRKKWEDLGICRMLKNHGLSCDGFFGNGRKDCRRWAVGVPYMLHIQDWRRLAPRWLHWTIQLRLIEKVRTHPAIGWLCEMLSYMIAAYELNLVHKAHRELVLLGEGPLKPENKMIHYGHAYPECCRHKEWGFYKHDWPDPELLSCTGRNIQDPNEYLPRMDELIKNRTMDHRAKWMLPSLAPRIFEAIREYRQRNCGPDWKPKKVPPGIPKIKKK